MTEPIRSETSSDGLTACLTITRVPRRNALDHNAVRALHVALDDLAQAPVRAVVITGEGTKAFCAGDDLKAYSERSEAESRAHFENGLDLMDKIAVHPCLMIAGIEGYCIGGGLELALACDLRVCGADALFALPEVRHMKALPTWGGLTRLAPLVGMAEARRMTLWGEDWTAERALATGLVMDVVGTGEAATKAQEMAAAFAKDADKAVVARAKMVMARSWSSPSDARALNLQAEQTQPFTGLSQQD